MSLLDDGPDWDASTETRYEDHRDRHRRFVASDLCDICRNDVCAEGSDLCPACLEEITPVEPTTLEEVAA